MGIKIIMITREEAKIIMTIVKINTRITIYINNPVWTNPVIITKVAVKTMEINAREIIMHKK